MAAITNLYSKYVYPKYSGQVPIVVMMHGWDGDATSITDATMERIADYGLFVISPGMRGRNSADGARDASALEIYDIYDVVEYVRSNYSAYASQTKAAIVGYSGGGGNALAAACKFPDYWNVAVSHFGMSDYGRDGTDGWYYNCSGGSGGATAAAIASSVGDTPANLPNNYYARDATAAIANYSDGYLYLYHDDQDGSVPYVHSTRIKNTMDGAGLTNYSYNITTTTDDPRWTHGYPEDNADLLEAEPTWAAKILSQAAWTVPTSGTITVIGYIKTKRFEITIGGRDDHAATVVYDTTTDSYTVTPLTGEQTVTITQGAKTGSDTFSTETEIIVS